MKYECIKFFPPMMIEVGDIVDIVKTDKGYNIENGVALLDAKVTYEHFRKKTVPGFKYAPYSHSKMETWHSCPKKFEWNYIIRPPMDSVPNPILEKGTLFHAILEFDIVDKLDKFDISDNFIALKKKDAEEIIGQALDFTGTSEIYNWIKNLSGVKIPEQEIFLGPKLEPVECLEDSLIRGFIDLLIYDEKSNSCYIFDWKTGGKSKDALKKWPKPKDQLELYTIWANQVFGVTHIETAFVYVEHDHMAKYVFEEDDIPLLIKKFKDKINNIETDEQFGKNLTQLCAWCNFRELCLGISIDREPRTITKEEIFEAGKGKPKANKTTKKNSIFLDKIRKKALS